MLKRFERDAKYKDRAERVHFYVTSIVRMLIVLAISFAVFEKNYFAVFIGILTILLTFLPTLFEKRYKVDLPPEFEIVITLFLYLSLFIGIGQEFYYRVWWWDIFFHGFAGIALGFAGFLILYTFYKKGKLKISLGMIAVFTFCFALALGAIWEVFEFGMDSSIDWSDMQKARGLDVSLPCNTRLGVIDTMKDLILDTIGALIASVSGYLYLKNKELFVFNYLIKRFEGKNPFLFKIR